MEDVNKNITVVGIGYVGTSISVLLSQGFNVTCLDVDQSRVDKFNNNISPIEDLDIQNFLDTKNLKLRATTDKKKAYKSAKFIIIAVPTNFDEEKNSFDTLIVERVIKDAINYNDKACIVIKSTVPIGFTEKLRSKYNYSNIIFSPEFLREGKALYDNLYPSRIIIGSNSSNAIEFSKILKSFSKIKNVTVMMTSSKEAEAIKLFANSYLAMRVSFFNELDSYSLVNNLDSKKIIDAISLDNRIGDGYNNPSFGYGGYCLPKDTKQLLTCFDQVPNSLIKSIVESNTIRKSFLVDFIINKRPSVVGIYRLNMKSGSDNIKFSSVLEMMDQLISKDIKVIIFEPLLKRSTHFNNAELIQDLVSFKRTSDIVIANRNTKDLEDIKNKLFTRDIYGID
tara:strand:+ start:255 stop:1439 length:1185 start_codon:yes stop_codon:yes gene_type:complete